LVSLDLSFLFDDWNISDVDLLEQSESSNVDICFLGCCHGCGNCSSADNLLTDEVLKGVRTLELGSIE
jgi:hypothetical protein